MYFIIVYIIKYNNNIYHRINLSIKKSFIILILRIVYIILIRIELYYINIYKILCSMFYIF